MMHDKKLKQCNKKKLHDKWRSQGLSCKRKTKSFMGKPNRSLERAKRTQKYELNICNLYVSEYEY